MVEKVATRRHLLRAAGSATLAAGTGNGVFLPKRARAQPKTLKILQWKHFVPAYDRWFNEVFAKRWGEENDTEVVVENVGIRRPQRPRPSRNWGTTRDTT
jgi:multiple sugar transport system substrate-binding protein